MSNSYLTAVLRVGALCLRIEVREIRTGQSFAV